MKISALRAQPFQLPLKEPFRMAEFTVHQMNYVRVEVEDDHGNIGVGEATPAWEVNGETPESVVGCVRLFSNYSALGYTLVDESLESLEDVKRLMDTVIHPERSYALVAGNSAAKAAIEQALMNCVAEQQGISLPMLFTKSDNTGEKDNVLSKAYTSVPYTHTIGIESVDKTLARAAQALDAGASVLRLKLGRRGSGNLPNFERDIRTVNETKNLLVLYPLNNSAIASLKAFKHPSKWFRHCFVVIVYEG